MGEEGQRFKREILGVAILLSLGSLYVLYPFLDAIILAVAASYLLRFAHKGLNKRLNNDTLASLIIIAAVLGVISISVYLFINNFFSLLSSLDMISSSLQQGLANIVELFNLSSSFKQNIISLVEGFSGRATDGLINVFAQMPSVLIHLGIFLVTAIYFYRDGARIDERINELIDSLPENEEKIARSLVRSIDSIFRGVFVTQFLVAVIVGLITAVGFHAISLITSPMPLIPLWAVLIGIAALFPLVAAFMFYGPVGIYYVFTGQPLKGSLIILFGIVVLNILPEVFVRPYIGSKQMDEHPLIIFTGFIAGPLTLGLKGLILGPLLLILTKEFILNYTDLVSSE